MWASTTSIDDIVGNEIEISKVISWLNEFFHDKRETTKKYAIITGEPGNGKTMLVEALAKCFNVPILIATSADIIDKESLLNFKKSLNLMTISGDIKKKIILIDDIDEFSNSPKRGFLRNQMMKNALAISDQPIIYTTRILHELPQNFTDTKNCVLCKMQKPLYSELLKLLERTAKEFGYTFTRAQLEKIVREAPSTRSAIMSLYSDDISSVLENDVNMFVKFKMIKERRLKVPLSNYEIKILTHNCKNLDELLYMTRLSTISDIRYRRDVSPQLLNIPLQLPGRFDFFTTKKVKYELNEEEEKLAKAIHVSAKVFKTEFKHLIVEEKKKEKEVTKREKKPNFNSLSNFY